MLRAAGRSTGEKRFIALTEAGRLPYDQALQLLARAGQLEALMRHQQV